MKTKEQVERRRGSAAKIVAIGALLQEAGEQVLTAYQDVDYLIDKVSELEFEVGGYKDELACRNAENVRLKAQLEAGENAATYVEMAEEIDRLKRQVEELEERVSYLNRCENKRGVYTTNMLRISFLGRDKPQGVIDYLSFDLSKIQEAIDARGLLNFAVKEAQSRKNAKQNSAGN